MNNFEKLEKSGIITDVSKKRRPRQAYNPYLPSWEYIPDGEPYTFGDRVYVYGSHDKFGGITFCLGDYVCWSAPVDDLSDWRYEGVIYPKTADPNNKDGHMCLYAPDVTVGPDGRYYLFYVLDKMCNVAVAVCDEPAGRYEFYGYIHYEDGTLLGNREGDEPQFDPGVLTEGDETFLFTGFCYNGDRSRHGAMLIVLDKDMLTVKEAPVFVVPGSANCKGTGYEDHAFFEAPSIRKRNGIYYFIYSSEQHHELCYATSDKPRGPYKYGGVIVSNNDLGISSYKYSGKSVTAWGLNNHGSMEKIGDDWYIFYHRHTNGTWFSRQGCAEKLTFHEDGSIEQAEITSCGLNGGPLSDMGEYPSYIACYIFNSDRGGDRFTYEDNRKVTMVTQDGANGDKCTGYVANIRNGSVIGYRDFDCHGVKKLKIYTKGYINGDFEVRTDFEGDPVGKVSVIGSNIWTAFEGEVDIPDGVHSLILTFKGGGWGSLRSFEMLH